MQQHRTVLVLALLSAVVVSISAQDDAAAAAAEAIPQTEGKSEVRIDEPAPSPLRDNGVVIFMG